MGHHSNTKYAEKIAGLPVPKNHWPKWIVTGGGLGMLCAQRRWESLGDAGASGDFLCVSAWAGRRRRYSDAGRGHAGGAAVITGAAADSFWILGVVLLLPQG